jgi:uncharacterized protein (TIGR04255 family)
MIRKVLKNKPLVEAIFELRWNLQEPAPGMRIDPHYKLLIGRIYDRVKDDYPFHEQLPTATMPDEIAGYVVQHRFRKEKDKWPLLQIGPGIITLNDTDGYVWEDFEKRIDNLINTLFEAYPDAEDNLKVNGLLLRYIDAIDFDFDFEKEGIFSFLEEQLKTNIQLHQELFEGTSVGTLPLNLDLRFSFPSAKPKGVVHLRFIRGKRKESDALIWETAVQSVTEDALEALEGVTTWIKDAHNLTDDWFFKLIEGELQRRFE